MKMKTNNYINTGNAPHFPCGHFYKSFQVSHPINTDGTQKRVVRACAGCFLFFSQFLHDPQSPQCYICFHVAVCSCLGSCLLQPLLRHHLLRLFFPPAPNLACSCVCTGQSLTSSHTVQHPPCQKTVNLAQNSGRKAVG